MKRLTEGALQTRDDLTVSKNCLLLAVCSTIDACYLLGGYDKGLWNHPDESMSFL